MTNATELLRRALAELIDQDETIRAEFCGMQPWRSPPIIKEIYDYLDAEPEAEPVNQRKVFIYTNCEGVYCVPVSECDCAAGANQFTQGYIVAKPEPEDEPVAWIIETELQDGSYTRWVCEDRKRHEEHHDSLSPIIPLYTRPEPKRKPMTDEEIVDEFRILIGILRNGTYFIEGVFAGVRFAEKHHNITN
jgi:hypothetical protein